MRIAKSSSTYRTILAGLRKPIDKIGLNKCNEILREMRGRGLSAERIRWDMLNTYIGYTQVNPDGAFTDDHITTALCAAAKELGFNLE